MNNVIKNTILNMAGFITIVMIALVTDQYCETAVSIGITTGTLVGITIIYNAIKRYIIGKREEIRIEHELIEKCLNEIDGLKFTIKEMNNKQKNDRLWGFGPFFIFLAYKATPYMAQENLILERRLNMRDKKQDKRRERRIKDERTSKRTNQYGWRITKDTDGYKHFLKTCINILNMQVGQDKKEEIA